MDLIMELAGLDECPQYRNEDYRRTYIQCFR